MPTTTARPLSRGWALRLLVLGGAFTLLLHSAGAHSLRAEEAWWAWAVHYDPVEVTGQRAQVDSLRALLRFVRDDAAQAWERLSGAPLSVQALGWALNGWALLVGDSEIALRLPRVWGALGLLALGTRLLWTRRALGLPLLLLTALLGWGLMQPAPDWRGFTAAVAQQRAADQAAFVAWSADTPIAYYNRRTPIRRGVSLDVGWRAYTKAELADLAARLEAYDVVWVLVDGRSGLVQTLAALLAADASRALTYREQLADFTAYRWQR